MFIIKFGGSLSTNPETISKIFEILEEISINHKFILLPGGGEFADIVLKYYETHNLNLKISHNACILAMDIVGLILSNFTKIRTSYELKPNTIFLPSRLLIDSDLEISNEITSDSIAVYVANKFDTETVILLKSVDGIFVNGKLCTEISACELEKINSNVVDSAFPNFIQKYKKVAYIINGNFPERLVNLINGREKIYTKIYL
ncbi:MAG: hypothetical protein CVT88_04830 [Candidatus Altiarchaeales archaeon HGW-Altiarchaeales-1]|nr:MAG: hypothetical protein CVT88_04830 [Candidatus Altiarchaeales archaeon HGW-Altiarchaeales-1]